MTLNEARRVLGVEAGADALVLKRAFRARVRASHPDGAPEHERARRTAETSRIVRAYRILSGEETPDFEAPPASSGARAAGARDAQGAWRPEPAPASRPAPARPPAPRPAGAGGAALDAWDFATIHPAGRWVGLLVALVVASLVGGPAGATPLALLFGALLLAVQAARGARGMATPSGLAVAAFHGALFGVIFLISLIWEPAARAPRGRA